MKQIKAKTEDKVNRGITPQRKNKYKIKYFAVFVKGRTLSKQYFFSIYLLSMATVNISKTLINILQFYKLLIVYT